MCFQNSCSVTAESACNALQADPAALSWELRAPLLLQELLEADASVICLQECNRFGALTPERL